MNRGSKPRALAVLAIIALGSVAACAEDEASLAEAARADSSAAGYNVGVQPARVSSRVDSSRVARAGAQQVAVGSQPQRAGATAPNGGGGTGSPRSGSTGSSTGSGPGGPGIAATSGTKAAPADTVHKVDAATRPPNVTAVKPVPDSARTPVPAGPVRVNEFLTYDAGSRTVSLQLVAGYNGLNGSLNYNGATSGSHGLAVPVGWRIHIAVANRDSDLQHSAIILREVLPPPIEPTAPAFSGAALPDLGEGLQDGDTGTLDFIAEHPGQFMIACGVPGHAQAGMWLKLAVTKGLAVPTYR